MPRNEGETSHQTALAGKLEGIRHSPSTLLAWVPKPLGSGSSFVHLALILLVCIVILFFLTN